MAAVSVEPAAASPAPAAPAPRSASALADAGWKALDRGRISSAAQSFEAALDRDPTHGWASFGLGYAREQQNRMAEARDQYCTAQRLASRDVELKREVEGRLRALDITCP